jgi:hypothetical protein
MREKICHRVEVVKELQSRVSSLGLPRWRWEIESLLLKHVHDDEDGTATESSSVALNKAKLVLTKYELMERLSLLELAVWKASLASDPFFSTMEELDVYWTLDRNFDPIAYANERRVTSGITVIIQGVLPFLSMRRAMPLEMRSRRRHYS